MWTRKNKKTVIQHKKQNEKHSCWPEKNKEKRKQMVFLVWGLVSLWSVDKCNECQRVQTRVNAESTELTLTLTHVHPNGKNRLVEFLQEVFDT